MTKQLRCPVCNWRLIDEGKYTVSKTKMVIDEKDEISDYYIKCKNCKKNIGIKKLG